MPKSTGLKHVFIARPEDKLSISPIIKVRLSIGMQSDKVRLRPRDAARSGLSREWVLQESVATKQQFSDWLERRQIETAH
jgi:hypothetical protein